MKGRADHCPAGTRCDNEEEVPLTHCSGVELLSDLLSLGTNDVPCEGAQQRHTNDTIVIRLGVLLILLIR